jgi:uncharacterized protein
VIGIGNMDAALIPADLSSLHYRLSDFVAENTKAFDESHDYSHMLKVVTNSFEILSHDDAVQKKCAEFPNIARIILISAWLHDVRDHKYPNSITEEELRTFIVSLFAEENEKELKTQQIFDIIENISFSKENKGLRKSFSEPLNTVLEVVGDADRLEAIGAIGIRRCEVFTREHGGTVPEDVITHCHEKLLRILPEGFIKTNYGKQIATPLHKEIEDYVKKFSSITQL